MTDPLDAVPPWRGDYLRGQYYLETELRKTSDLLNKLAGLDLTDPLPLEDTASTVEDTATDEDTTSDPPAAPVASPPVSAAPTASTAATEAEAVPALDYDPRTRVGKYVQDWVGTADAPGRMERAMRDADALTAWQAKLEDGRRAERSAHKSVRLAEITRRLKEAGAEEVE